MTVHQVKINSKHKKSNPSWWLAIDLNFNLLLTMFPIVHVHRNLKARLRTTEFLKAHFLYHYQSIAYIGNNIIGDLTKFPSFRTMESLYEELVHEGILVRPNKTRIADYVGEYSYLGTTLRQANIEPMPSLSDVRRVITEFCILPLGTSGLNHHHHRSFIHSLIHSFVHSCTYLSKLGERKYFSANYMPTLSFCFSICFEWACQNF